jgi:hypothetical protein
MAIVGMLLAGLAALLAIPVGGFYIMLAWTAGQAPGAGSRRLAAAIGLVAALDLGGAGLACWREFAGAGGLLAALGSLALSALLAWAARGLAHGIANP